MSGVPSKKLVAREYILLLYDEKMTHGYVEANAIVHTFRLFVLPIYKIRFLLQILMTLHPNCCHHDYIIVEVPFH